MITGENNFFRKLNEINVNEHTEEKNGLTYLSWMWAWQVLKLNYPESYSTVYKPENGWNYWTDGKTCWVETGVTLVYYDDAEERREIENIEMLPIMDYRNQSIPLEKVTSMDVNKAIQRSITKCIARHGLGAYIYAGEDLPEESDETRAKRLEQQETDRKELATLIGEIDELVKKKTSSMNRDEKVSFARDVVVPIIGGGNYKVSKDKVALTALLNKLKETN